MLRITLTKGLVGKRDDQKKVVRALGLRKFNSSVLHADSPTIRGMVNKVHHLVTVVEDKDAKDEKAKAAPAAKAKKTADKAAK
jgi:large subunit ribosomal protein L30